MERPRVVTVLISTMRDLLYVILGLLMFVGLGFASLLLIANAPIYFRDVNINRACAFGCVLCSFACAEMAWWYSHSTDAKDAIARGRQIHTWLFDITVAVLVLRFLSRKRIDS